MYLNEDHLNRDFMSWVFICFVAEFKTRNKLWFYKLVFSGIDTVMPTVVKTLLDRIYKSK